MMETANMSWNILDNEYYIRDGEILQRKLLEQKKLSNIESLGWDCYAWGKNITPD